MAQPRILILRRDNIGDLVCTTPLIAALRRQLPRAHLAALVTSYNRAVLAGNPDLDAVHAYTKAKHREAGTGIAAIYFRRLQLIRALRTERFDWLLLPGGRQASSLRLARWLGARQTLVRDEQDAVAGEHEVEQCCHLLVRMGLRYETPHPQVVADSAALARIQEQMRSAWGDRQDPVLGLHISARKPGQRWPAERFVELARRIHAAHGVRFALLWAPGSSTDAMHPGDDEKAQAVVRGASGVPILPLRTDRLEQLIAALSLCDRLICSDGGAMHVAAALGKPIVCLFGNSSPRRWGPWGVPHEVVQPPSLDVNDVRCEEVFAAYERLPKAA